MAGKFKAWLEGYLGSACGDPPTSGLSRKDVEIVLAKLKSVADEELFRELRDPKTGFNGFVPARPKSDPTAVPSTDDVVEELKQQYQKTTFHHPV